MPRRVALLLGLVLGSLSQSLAAPRFVPWGLAHAAEGEGEVRTPVLVLVAPSTPLLARIEGQLSDLDVEVQVEVTLEPGTDLDTSAARIARERGAEWLVWTRERPASDEAAGSYVCIWSSGGVETYCRQFSFREAREEPGDSSAGYELAALSVRSAVRARLITLAAEAALNKPPPEPKPVNTERVENRPVVDSEPASRETSDASTRLWLGLGGHWLWDGSNPSGRLLLAPRVELGRGRFLAALEAGIAQRADVNLEQVQVSSGRITAALDLGLVAFDSKHLLILPRARGGLLWTTRASTAGAGAVATGDMISLGPYFGAGLQLLVPLANVADVGAAAALDWAPSATDWVVLDDADLPVAGRRTWHVQPNVGVVFRVALW